MGYKPARQLVKLDFSETEHAGLEVTTRKVTVGDVTEFARLIDVAEQADGKDLKASDLAAVTELFTRFGNVLVSWNVVDDEDRPVPPTAAGLAGLDLDFAMAVISAWFVAVTSAPPPLRSASPGGATRSAAEASLPMEALPASQPS